MARNTLFMHLGTSAQHSAPGPHLRLMHACAVEHTPDPPPPPPLTRVAPNDEAPLQAKALKRCSSSPHYSPSLRRWWRRSPWRRRRERWPQDLTAAQLPGVCSCSRSVRSRHAPTPKGYENVVLPHRLFQFGRPGSPVGITAVPQSSMPTRVCGGGSRPPVDIHRLIALASAGHPTTLNSRQTPRLFLPSPVATLPSSFHCSTRSCMRSIAFDPDRDAVVPIGSALVRPARKCLSDNSASSMHRRCAARRRTAMSPPGRRRLPVGVARVSVQHHCRTL